MLSVQVEPPWFGTLRTRVVPNKGICQTKGNRVSGLSQGFPSCCCPGRAQRPDLWPTVWLCCPSPLTGLCSLPLAPRRVAAAPGSPATWPYIRRQPLLGLPAPTPYGASVSLGTLYPKSLAVRAATNQTSSAPSHSQPL